MAAITQFSLPVAGSAVGVGGLGAGGRVVLQMPHGGFVVVVTAIVDGGTVVEDAVVVVSGMVVVLVVSSGTVVDVVVVLVVLVLVVLVVLVVDVVVVDLGANVHFITHDIGGSPCGCVAWKAPVCVRSA